MATESVDELEKEAVALANSVDPKPEVIASLRAIILRKILNQEVSSGTYE